MIRSKIIKTAIVGLGIGAAPLAIALTSPGTASADPGVCVSGPWGYAYACVEAPGWVDNWYDGPYWQGHGRGHGHGHGDWEDD